ncbi:MAG: tRNA pseudouridine(38-40) synthase TruA [Thermonemataceae bacterium]
MRYFIEVAYKGTYFHGWQIQPNANTVQETIEKALSTILREKISIVGSGRTDTGVHATQQFAHFDTNIPLEAALLLRLNALLPQGVIVKQLFKVNDEAHARFDASSRSYFYQISQFPSPFLENLTYQDHRHFDLTLMNQAAKKLLLYKDFEAFSKVKTDVHTFNCNITEAYWEESSTPFTQTSLLLFHITANRFLRGMVRAIVGTLLEIGLGRITVQRFEEIILSKNRQQAGRAVAASGLFLSEVQYPYPLQPLFQERQTEEK